ncbi:DUF397 domain-containing protein [Streptomyces sp. NPDC048551]|uniref:DUF397 domain-containing protein n=1 Tax=Streptomyces sp. NPDC048551 TaxID=3155758 RepID=UPI0034391296
MKKFVFVKSSYSGDQANTECVEVATNVPGTVALRDSKRPDGPVVQVSGITWEAFVAAR